MGWSNPPIPWSELEQRLSGRSPVRASAPPDTVMSTKRKAYLPPAELQQRNQTSEVPYVELHAHSAFSFLDGASMPEHLIEEAVRLGVDGIAITDHDGLYGAVRFAEAAESFPDILTIYGAELSLGLSAPQLGMPDPEGTHLVVLARGQAGYHRLAGIITDAQLAGGQKGRPLYSLEQIAEQAGGQLVVLTGCRKGAVRTALGGGRSFETFEEHSRAREAARWELHKLVELFGEHNVVVELFDHGHPSDDVQNRILYDLATKEGLAVVATGSVHYDHPQRAPLANVLSAVRARRSLDQMDGHLPVSAGAHLRSGAEMALRFAAFPGVIERTVQLGTELAFRLRTARPRLPKQQVPAGHTEMTWLRELVWRGANERYPQMPEGHRARLQRELEVIEQKDFPGYFLIVHDIVQEARRRKILCQGRGSAANSAVCYVLGITAVDSIFYQLPFERFLSALRDEEPDIDIDIDSNRREELIQYVYERYGRRNAAQVANVITYRPKAAVRDVAKALGFTPGQQDNWSRQIEHWTQIGPEPELPASVRSLAEELLGMPRHLGIHSGGMVLTDRPVGEVVPIEHARMDGRTVLQWDKDDCAWMGLVKFDLLGLGMLSAIDYAFALVDEHLGEPWTLATIPKEEAGVYDMLCRADAIGVFQVESRAQLATLPRLKPRSFYDLAVEIALIRPGPVQGQSVHPYIRRRNGQDPITYVHPKVRPVLERTLGIPIFQEQLMMMAVAVADCTPADADVLRRAMGSKRGVERISRIRDQLYSGMQANGLTQDECDAVYAKIEAFANFGFAESHAISFAQLVYASAWLKLHYPAAFLAALLRAQPMGFYSAQTLVADARRRGVVVLRPSVLRSDVVAGLEINSEDQQAPVGRDACLHPTQPPVGAFEPEAAEPATVHRRDAQWCVRLGLSNVTGISRELAQRIVDERTRGGDYVDTSDLARRVRLNADQLEALATAGAFEDMGLDRREALWAAGEAARERVDYLEGTHVAIQPPLLPLLSDVDRLAFDVWSTGIATDDHPLRHLRERLAGKGAVAIDQLALVESGTRVLVGGAVTHRQRPSTARGITFLNLEDETGMVNVIVSVGAWARYRRIVRDSAAVLVRGILERNQDGVVNLVADGFESLPAISVSKSRNFR